MELYTPFFFTDTCRISPNMYDNVFGQNSSFWVFGAQLSSQEKRLVDI